MSKICAGILLFALVGCAQVGNEYLGTWKDSNVTVTISKDGNSFLVKSDNPNGMVNGSFSGKIKESELVLNQSMFGNISYSKSKDAILFAGATLKRVK